MKVESKNSLGEDVVLYVRKPTPKDGRDAKMYGNTVASQIMLKKDTGGKPAFITRNQVRKVLRETGKLSEEDENKIITLSKDIKESEDKLIAGGLKKSEGKKIALDLREKRDQLFELLLSTNELDEHTLEWEVENAQMDFLVAACTFDEEGNKVFPTVEDYISKAADEQYAYDAADALKTLIYGSNEDTLKQFIENKFLVKYGFVNDKLQLVDKDGHLVDRDGNKINENGQRVDENEEVLNKRSTEIGEFLDDETLEKPYEAKYTLSMEPVEAEKTEEVVTTE